MPDTVSVLQKPGTDFVRESVDGLWGWSRDLVIRGRGDLFATRSTILFGPKSCELYRVGVEIHQKSLEPGMMLMNDGEVPSLHSRHERHVRDLDNLPLVNAFLAVFPDNLDFVGNHKRTGRTSLRLSFLRKRSDLPVLIVLKVAVGHISVVFRRFFFIDCFLEIFRLGLCEVPEKYFETMV